MIELKNVSKNFIESDGNVLEILKDVNLKVEQGEKVAILGPSGAGKSTLLSVMAGLDTPSSGSVVINNEHIENRSEQELAELRNKNIGFIFQSFELISSFTALENVMLPIAIRGEANREQAAKMLEQVGLSHRSHHYPSQLSGGEKQRTAIARALIHNPSILFADEPTGNLDEKTSGKVFDLLINQAKEHNSSFIMITHDESLAQSMDTVYRLKDKSLHKQ